MLPSALYYRRVALRVTARGSKLRLLRERYAREDTISATVVGTTMKVSSPRFSS